LGHHKGHELEPKRQADRAAHDGAMADIKPGHAIILRRMVGIRNKTSDPGRVAIGIVQRVTAEEREERTLVQVEVGNELVLIVKTGGLILVDIPAEARRAVRKGRDVFSLTRFNRF
jgi:hypothetical protein